MELSIKIDELKEAFSHYSEKSECIYYFDTSTGKIILENGGGDPIRANASKFMA